MGYPDPALPGMVDGYIDPKWLTLHMDIESVSTPDQVDLDDCGTIEDGGSARSPSSVNSPSTMSDFSSYVGSGDGSPNDVGFSPVGMEHDSPAVTQDPTGLNAASGDTMHDITAAQHGVIQEMAMSANEFAALQDEYVNICNQAPLNMNQACDFNTIHSIPNPPAIMTQSNGNPSHET